MAQRSTFLKGCFWKPPTDAANPLISHLLRMCCSYIRLLKLHSHRGPINDCVTHQKQTMCPLTVKYLQCFPYLQFNHSIFKASFTKKNIQIQETYMLFSCENTISYCNDFTHYSAMDNCRQSKFEIPKSVKKKQREHGLIVLYVTICVPSYFWRFSSNN